MRIAVNLLPFRRQLAGAGRYTQNVLKHLTYMDKENEYILFVSTGGAAHFVDLDRRVRGIICPIPSGSIHLRILWEQCVLPLQLRDHRIDLLFTPSVAIPLLWCGRKVTVIYDAIPFHPEIKKYSRWRNPYVRWMTRYAARHSDLVVTDSQSSCRDLAQHCAIPESRIVVAPNAAGAEFQPVRDPTILEGVRRRYDLPEQFVLFVGTREPGKNLIRLVEAFRQLKAKHPDLRHQLVLAGARGWSTGELDAKIARQPDSLVRVVGFIADQDLPALYSAADLFVYPSLYEGFGLPVLEAMACGTPVITSNVSAMPEVVGEAGVLITPENVNEIARAMEQLLLDPAMRELHSRAGLERAACFRWQDTAAVILDGFRKVAHC